MFWHTLLFVAVVAKAQDVKLKPSAIDEVITPNGQPKNIPSVGFGTWMLPNNAVGADAVARAIKMGYRHIDGATAYTNQDAVGKGIAKALAEDKSIKREHLWVTTKLWATRHKDVPGGNDINLKQLGLDYIDLALVHFPIGNSQKPKTDAKGQTILGANGKPETETVAEYDYVEVSCYSSLLPWRD
jgi:diketogulonate reductase-like aldo/keto reductase